MRSLTKDRKSPPNPRAKASRKPARAARDVPGASNAGRRAKSRDGLFTRALRRIRAWFTHPVLLLALGLAALVFAAALVASGSFARAVNTTGDGFAALIADAGFGISEIHIAGNNRTQPETILAALGFAPGQSIFAADLHDARARLLALDWVASADVQRRYPDAIFVRLVEKRPFALWQQPSSDGAPGSIVVVERTGAVITAHNIERFARLPKLVGTGAPQAAAALVEAVAAHRVVSARVKAFERQSDRRWNLILDDGVVVKLPEAGWQKQIDVLERLIIEGVLERDVTEIDLRSPTHYFFVVGGAAKKAVQRGDKI